MLTDDRDVLDVLKFELDFIEKGGYGRSVRTPWLATSIFQDSLTCLNFGDPNRSHPCDECLLMALVPAGALLGESSLPSHSAHSRGRDGCERQAEATNVRHASSVTPPRTQVGQNTERGYQPHGQKKH
jgi:hypothetical protein